MPKNEDNSKNEDDIKENLLRRHLTANSTMHHFYGRGEFCIIKQVSNKNVGGHLWMGPLLFFSCFAAMDCKEKISQRRGRLTSTVPYHPDCNHNSWFNWEPKTYTLFHVICMFRTTYLGYGLTLGCKLKFQATMYCHQIFWIVSSQLFQNCTSGNVLNYQLCYEFVLTVSDIN